jgi:hypothetical protein
LEKVDLLGGWDTNCRMGKLARLEADLLEKG